MTVAYDRFGVTVHAGDCLDVLAELDDASVHAVVTDPPYGLEFMGKDWDKFKSGGKRPGIGAADGSKFRQNMGTPSFTTDGNPTCRNCGGDKYRNGDRKCSCPAPNFGNPSAAQTRAFGEWCLLWAAECLRVLKPGGHLLAFGGSRTWHRLAAAVEEAGFEVRDSIAWLYASGFPKSLDVSKAIDKAAGAERELVGQRDRYRDGHVRQNLGQRNHVYNPGASANGVADITAPATSDAARWVGWGTALKPAFEPIVVARKPLAGTVAGNVLEHGVGALNIDGCRVAAGQDYRDKCASVVGLDSNRTGDAYGEWSGVRADSAHGAGRWPSNVVITHAADCEACECGARGPHDLTSDCVIELDCVPGCPVRDLDEQTVGKRAAKGSSGSTRGGGGDIYGGGKGYIREDIGQQLTGYEAGGSAARFFPVFRFEAKAPAAERPRVDGAAHPTVKPLALMRWLVRLVTPPGGVVLDPFLGSGTTAHAARAEGFRCVGIERDETYLPLIRARLDTEQDDLFGGVA